VCVVGVVILSEQVLGSLDELLEEQGERMSRLEHSVARIERLLLMSLDQRVGRVDSAADSPDGNAAFVAEDVRVVQRASELFDAELASDDGDATPGAGPGTRPVPPPVPPPPPAADVVASPPLGLSTPSSRRRMASDGPSQHPRCQDRAGDGGAGSDAVTAPRLASPAAVTLTVADAGGEHAHGTGASSWGAEGGREGTPPTPPV